MLLSHLIGYRVFTVTGTAVDAGAKYKMGVRIARLAKQLVDVAAAIADVDTPCRVAKQRSRLPQIVHPAHAFLVLDRHASRIDVPLQCGTAFELLSCPKLDCRQSQRQSVARHRQARMHQDPTHFVVERAGRRSDLARTQVTNLPAVLPVISELGRVVQNEN